MKLKARIKFHTIELDEGRVRGGVDSDTQRKDRPTVSRERAVNGSEQTVQFSAQSPAYGTIKPDNMPCIFHLKMQLPSGKNAVQITRRGKRYPTQRFKVWRKKAIAQIGEPLCFDGPVSMVVEYTPGDRIRRDVPGLLDALCHLIEKIGIVQDDAQVKNVQWTTCPVERGKPSCWVTISALREIKP